MKNVLWGLVFLVVFCGCGGGGGGGDNGSDNGGSNGRAEDETTPVMTAFQLTAQVAEPEHGGKLPSGVETEDELVVTFSYDPEQVSSQGNVYTVGDPQGLNVALNGRSFGTGAAQTGVYEIAMVDGAQQGAEDRITFTFSELFSAAEAGGSEAGLQEFRIELSLADSSGEVFSDQTLPVTLDLRDFDSGYFEMGLVDLLKISLGGGGDFIIGNYVWVVPANFESFSLSQR